MRIDSVGRSNAPSDVRVDVFHYSKVFEHMTCYAAMLIGHSDIARPNFEIVRLPDDQATWIEHRPIRQYAVKRARQARFTIFDGLDLACDRHMRHCQLGE